MSGSKLSDPTASAVASDLQGGQLLGLTVHDLPPVGGAVDAAQSGRHARWKLMAVLLVCVAPVVASYFTYYVIRPEGRRNFGALIQPQRPMPSIATIDLLGNGGQLTDLQRQWLLVSVAPSACDAACEKRLYLQRQLRESLGKEKERMDWVWLVTDQAPVRKELAQGIASADVRRVDPVALSQWLQPEAGHRLEEHLYMVDPMGNWMMRFPANLDAAGASRARRDLESLMRGSAGWDAAGRSTEP